VYAAATAALARAGLADATTWIAPTGRLSDGQRFRARLAIAYARAGRGPRISADGCRSTDAPPQTASGKPETENLFRLLLIDEFGSGLDEQTAETVAVNLRRAVDELGLCAVLATAHDRLAGPLRPDERLHRPAGVRCGPSAFPASPSRRPAVIEIPPRVADEFLRTRHYKAGPVRGVVRAFGLFAGERMIGAATLAHPGGSLQAHLACGGDFMRAGAAAARRIRATLMINRVALDETVRGRGLGTALTAAVLQRCGAEVVLACAAMARHHPLFERAGMRPAGCASDGKPMLVWYRSWGAGRQGPAVSDER
jgi:GNAT superfamily N-acetyltransferase